MTPFVIVGTPRTGSFLLLTGLQQHARIEAYRELMHPSDIERAGYHAIIRGEAAIYFSGHGDAITFLKQQVYERGETSGAVGFKLFAESKERNAIHASDSDENADREAKFFFSEAEIVHAR